MTAPQDDPELVHKIAAMTAAELQAVIDKARGHSASGRAEMIRAAEESGDRAAATRLKIAQLGNLVANPKKKG